MAETDAVLHPGDPVPDGPATGDGASKRAIPPWGVHALNILRGKAVICLVLGFLASMFLIGSQTGVAIPAALSTLSAVFLALVGRLVFHERMSRLQWAGALTTLVGVATLAATQ